MTRSHGLALYDGTAARASAPVIRQYSNSFRLATSFFPRRCRSRIGSIYALVRIADEIVDGTAGEAGLDTAAQEERLNELETETFRAIDTGFSSNLVVHAFAKIVRECGIDSEPISAFFASMRRDIEKVDFDDAEYRTYIHGSAEAVGLMCLGVFLHGHEVSSERRAVLEAGAAHLGAAFQKVNFLRDLGDDAQRLGRAYMPGVEPAAVTAEAKASVVADINDDLVQARRAIPALPRDCRRAVRIATEIFAELLRRLERLPAQDLSRVRVSVPPAAKAAIALRITLVPERK